MLVVGRFLGGIGVGMLAMIARKLRPSQGNIYRHKMLTSSEAVYMGEISPAEIRGTLLVLEEWCIVVGAVAGKHNLSEYSKADDAIAYVV